MIASKGKPKIKLVAIEEEKIYDGKTTSSKAPMLFGELPSDYVVVVTQKYKTKNVGNTEIIPYILVFDRYGSAVECEVNKQKAKGVIKPFFFTLNAQKDIKEYDGTTLSFVEPLVSETIDGDTLQLMQEFETPTIGRGKKLIPSFQLEDGNNGRNYQVKLFTVIDGEIFSSTGGGIEALSAISDYLGTDEFNLSYLNGLTDFAGEVCAVEGKKIYLKLEARKRQLQIVELEKSHLAGLEIELGDKIRIALRNKKIEARSMKQSSVSISRSLSR